MINNLHDIIEESVNYVLENYFGGGYEAFEEDEKGETKHDERKADYKTETAKEKERRNQVEEFFRNPGVNIAQYAYRLYTVEVKEGNDTNEMKNARSRFMKCLNHEKNESGYPYSFTSAEINELYSIISSDVQLSEGVKRNINEGQYDNSPITKWVYWCFNFPFPQEWIPQIEWNGAGAEHFMKKFQEAYQSAGSQGAMNRFFVELDKGNQQKLIEYVMNNY